jgi:hypothetical protein
LLRPGFLPDAFFLPSVFATALAAGQLDEDIAHGLRSRGEEMAAALLAWILVPHQAEIRLMDRVRLMDRGRWLEGLAGLQPGRERRGHAAELRVEYRQQFRRRLLLCCRFFFLAPRHERKTFAIFGPRAAPFPDEYLASSFPD